MLDRAIVTTGSIEGSFAHCPLPPTSAGMELDRELIAVRPVIEGLPAAARSCRATPCTACVHLSARVRMDIELGDSDTEVTIGNRASPPEASPRVLARPPEVT